MIWDLEKKSLISKLDGHTDAINSLDVNQYLLNYLLTSLIY